MRFNLALKTLFMMLSMALITAVMAPSAQAADAFCPSAAHAKPTKTPADLLPAVAKAFQLDPATARDATYVRCVGPKIMGCYVGANLVCDKADTRRVLPGATAYCHDNPGSKIVPMVATGHSTIYEWTCQGSRAVAGKAVMKIDRQGYLAVNWKEIQ
jgi:hypothetical protein